jgi:1-acyl-sn-glycerol-3-phosphate acyltransferase
LLVGYVLCRLILLGLFAALTAALVAFAVGPEGDPVRVGGWAAAGVGLGAVLAGPQRHPRRALGLATLGATGLFAGLLVPALGGGLPPALCVLLGALWGLVNLSLTTAYLGCLPHGARGQGRVVRSLPGYALVLLVGLATFTLVVEWVPPVSGQARLPAAVAGALAAVGWWLHLREVLEQILEIVLWPFYGICGRGPGLQHFPLHGPVVVVANHSAWLDPMFLAKVLPRRLIPMMTSIYYDLPVIRWLMVHLAHAIRVQAATFRRDVPELRQAVAALDRGECLVIFPEGSMRRREERLLRQFGQGVWHILNERPQTPVVACWIEGGWRSFFSYWHGPPTKNKRFDFWRRVEVAVGMPQVLSVDVLCDQRATRKHLMQACLDARQYLGLEPLTVEQVVQDGPAADGQRAANATPRGTSS